MDRAISLKLEDGEVSVAKDKIHILNAIAGNADLNADPPAAHQNFDRANHCLHWRFALAAYEQDMQLMKNKMSIISWKSNSLLGFEPGPPTL